MSKAFQLQVVSFIESLQQIQRLVMNRNHSYWMIGDAPSTPPTPTSSLNHQSSSENMYQGPHEAISTTRKSPTLVTIRPDSSISWSPSQKIVSSNPAVILASRNALEPPIIAGGNLSVVQHVPPTNQQTFRGDSELQATTGINDRVTSTSNSDLAELPSEPVNYREDIKLDDKALVTISTKELNRRLKKEGIGKARQKEIKSERRTLKNRGYASNCRVSREEEEKRLELDIARLQNEIARYPPVDKLERHYQQLRKDCKDLKVMLNITDDSDDSLSDVETQTIVKEEEEYTSTEQESESEDN